MNYMQPHAHHTDPNKDSQVDPIIDLVQCQECRAMYPLSHFGIAKYSAKGRSRSCNLCRAQGLRIRRKAKGAISKVDDSQVRNVLHHNTAILNVAVSLSTIEMNCYAFDVVTKVEYKVFFGKSSTLGLSCMALFDTNGATYQEYAYSGIKEVLPNLIALLKVNNLRLELTEVDMINSKQTIYYL